MCSCGAWLRGLFLDSLPCADTVMAVALMPNDPYVLLGCQSGDIQVAALVDEHGEPAVGATAVRSLSMTPYEGTACIPARSRLGCLQCNAMWIMSYVFAGSTLNPCTT